LKARYQDKKIVQTSKVANILLLSSTFFHGIVILVFRSILRSLLPAVYGSVARSSKYAIDEFHAGSLLLGFGLQHLFPNKRWLAFASSSCLVLSFAFNALAKALAVLEPPTQGVIVKCLTNIPSVLIFASMVQNVGFRDPHICWSLSSVLALHSASV